MIPRTVDFKNQLESKTSFKCWTVAFGAHAHRSAGIPGPIARYVGRRSCSARIWIGCHASMSARPCT